ncbi:hypothetical protein ACFSE0_15515 [Ochrobactrum teleogrylli]|uniref:Uncharacterized protein n=1 Tax=Ochrobactrum teleogrylli TaxID=2479765 RepID=A0ABY2Y649_9HYPH|nr:hypothetical protein [[Ochrobactrum] teleogrylli]TNV17012.1 hypothetical protein FIC94_07535 [[Ochrobactrum] teleogrylli]
MLSKLIIAGAILVFSIPYSFSADRGIFGNCNAVKGTTGKVTYVSLGVDDETAGYISFHYVDNISKAEDDISVKATTGDSGGHETYLALMTAVISNLDFKIERCYSDQLAGFSLLPPVKKESGTEK